MSRRNIYKYIGVAGLSLMLEACNIPTSMKKAENKNMPGSYINSVHQDSSSNSADINWKDYFTDPYLQALIDTALQSNQELNITLQEVAIARNEVRARKGEYLPFVGLRGGGGVDKAARYTNVGAMEATTEMEPGRKMPEPVPDMQLSAYATWEVDIWHKLRNAKKAAAFRYLATIDGKNFVVTNLVAEVANSYYELLALDKGLDILQKNIEIQNNALRIVKLQKEAAHVTELAVRRFEAQVLSTQSLQYSIQQKITETENRINYLLGRYPQPILRYNENFSDLVPAVVQAGIPTQLLSNRPDIRKAEQELTAAGLDVKVARTRFYPSLSLSASAGYRAFNPAYLLKTPESLLYSVAGDLAAPIINRNAIRAAYNTANAKQMQALYNYERIVINAYVEVTNELARVDNMGKANELKQQQMQALYRSVDISNDLFRSARADYMEVLLTQRDALEAKFEQIETQMQRMTAMVNIYRALGGGWK